MKRFFYLSLRFSIAMLCLFLFQSCVDNDYDWDKMNKEAEFNLPTVPIGSFDTIFINEQLQLPEIPPIEGLPNFQLSVAYQHILEDMFNEDLVDYIFYEGNTVSLSGLVDVIILDKNSSLSLSLVFEVLDTEKNVINEIKIPSQVNLTYGKDQAVKILIAPEYMPYFESKSARHLSVKLVIKANTNKPIKDTDYILFKDIVLKSEGLHFKF